MRAEFIVRAPRAIQSGSWPLKLTVRREWGGYANSRLLQLRRWFCSPGSRC